MRKLVAAMAVVVAGVLAMPVLAEEGQEKPEKVRQEKPERHGDRPEKQRQEKREFTPVKGEITAVDGNKITVGEQSFTITDATEIVSGGKAYTEGLKVGQRIGAKVKDGVALRVEIAPKKPAREGDGPKKNAERARKEGQPKKEQRD